MSNVQPGWYDDGAGQQRWWDGERWTNDFQPQPEASGGTVGVVDKIKAAAAVGSQPRPSEQGAAYVVLQVILKEKYWGTGSGNLTELENAINAQAARGYRLHTISTAASGSKGMGGGDRIQATMVFERLT
jgi:hypothetical protein